MVRIDELAPDPDLCGRCGKDVLRGGHAWWCSWKDEVDVDGSTEDVELASEAECEGAARDSIWGSGW